jgi:hypothetical protein
VTEPWSPSLELRESGGQCRLWMANYLCGDGATLQDAADDLVARLLALALRARTEGGVRWSRAAGPLDIRWLHFLQELGELASRGADIRPRVFGVAAGD